MDQVTSDNLPRQKRSHIQVILPGHCADVSFDPLVHEFSQLQIGNVQEEL